MLRPQCMDYQTCRLDTVCQYVLSEQTLAETKELVRAKMLDGVQ